MTHQTLRAAAVLLALVAPEAARAMPSYSAMYVFGDSLSDRGNLAEGFGQAFVDPPSYHYSFTNGPVAVSVLANRLGLAADPSLWLAGFQDTAGIFPAGYQPGTNYAVGGATAQEETSNGLPGINLPKQVGAYLDRFGKVADPNALYTVFIGGNDVRDATLPNGGGSAAISDAVSTEIEQISKLVTAGARKFLVVNVTDVGAIPEFAQENPSLAPQATAYTEQYNAELAAALGTLATPTGTSIVSFDLLSYNRALLANASQFGIVNTTDPCWVINDIGTLAATPTAACGPGGGGIDGFAFWNNVHPTRQVHALIADGFAQALDGNPFPFPVPEPSSLVVMVTAVLGALGWRRRGAPAGRHVRGRQEEGEMRPEIQVLA